MDEDRKPHLRGRSLGSWDQAKGSLVVINTQNDVQEVSNGDVVFIPQSISFKNRVLLFYELIRSGVTGILCESIGRTDHAVLLTDELGVVCLSDVSSSITKYEGEMVTIRGDDIYRGEAFSDSSEENPDLDIVPKTEIDIKMNLGFPEVLDRYPSLTNRSDGVGFMRLEFILMDILENTHPHKYINEFGQETLECQLADQIEPILESISESVWIRTDDFSVSQLESMEGGDRYESREDNSMLGWRGISRSLDDPSLYDMQLGAIRRLLDRGHRNIGLFPPMTRFYREYTEWQTRAKEAGLDDISFGLMVETPAAALTFEQFVADIEFVVFGSNDLTQFTLAIDRGNERLEPKFDESADAVLSLFDHVISIAKENDIATCIGGKAASDTPLVEHLLDFGIDALSVNPDPQTITRMRRFVDETEPSCD